MITAIVQGDSEVFEDVYIKYSQKVYAYFLKKTKCNEDAKDLLQTTFLKLWQYRRSLSTKYLLDQQLFHIARTVFIDYIRQQNKLVKINKSVSVRMKVNPSHLYIFSDFDMKSYLQIALSRMPQLRKQIFELHRIQGYTYKEIAALLSIPVKSVDNNLAKALKELHKIALVLILLIINIHS